MTSEPLYIHILFGGATLAHPLEFTPVYTCIFYIYIYKYYKYIENKNNSWNKILINKHDNYNYYYYKEKFDKEL